MDTRQDLTTHALAPADQEEAMPVHDEPTTFADNYRKSPAGQGGLDMLYASHPEYLERIGIDAKMKRVLDEH